MPRPPMPPRFPRKTVLLTGRSLRLGYTPVCAALHPGLERARFWGAAAAGGEQKAAAPLILAPGKVGDATGGAVPGAVFAGPDGLSVKAHADCWYVLSTVRPQGKKDMSARDLLNGILRGLPGDFADLPECPYRVNNGNFAV